MKRLRRAPWQAPKPAVTVRGSTIDPQLRHLVRERAGGCCELCGVRIGAHTYQCHHRKLRSRGGQDSACNLAALCGLCHRRVHNHPAWSTDQGFMLRTADDPARMPMALRGERWVLLTTDGGYVETREGVAS